MQRKGVQKGGGWGLSLEFSKTPYSKSAVIKEKKKFTKKITKKICEKFKC